MHDLEPQGAIFLVHIWKTGVKNVTVSEERLDSFFKPQKIKLAVEKNNYN